MQARDHRLSQPSTSTHYPRPSNTATPSNNMRMPSLMYGTAWKGAKTTDLVVQAVLNGFTGIDTACQPKVSTASDDDQPQA